MKPSMPAMILAAGKGTRLPSWTNHTPKPLVPVAGEPVIFRTLQQLAAAGFERVVINTHHLAEQLHQQVGDGQKWGVKVQWSPEALLLETGGGVRQALSLLDEAQFLVINGDILWQLDLGPLLSGFDGATMDGLLGLVANPADGRGDFVRGADGRLARGRGAAGSLTYSGIQILSQQAVARYPIEPFSLNRLYDDAMAAGRLQGVVLNGFWADMGTPQRLADAERVLRENMV
uniref:Putative glucosamine-1-phosphate N-acetyltransferase n=1 Tax=Magnetococcus massalia (strain MO-1) TaxID=451514 RepID=A0A1S7LG71_MAGMO|nr:Putative glucosamine-1-phosphate N-acetyltransferase [Candidatus Magnetococcus massalia]